MPVGRAAEQRHSVAQRKKNPRLQGADLYVTRLGWAGKPQCRPRRSTGKAAARREKYRSTALESNSSTPEDDSASVASEDTTLADSISTLSISSASTTSASQTASLHDELLYPNPTPKSALPTPPASSCGHVSIFDPSQIHASRPCYRCISFMHAVGIRRVFWTNDAGEWEGGKVAELVEAMDGGFEDGGEGGGGGGLMGNGLFVTKHEVLMLRRMMGAEGGGAGGEPTRKKGKGGGRRGK